MATNSFEMQSTECPICHENYNEPKILPCAHLLCRDCLVSWMKKKIDALCPLCQSAIVDPQDSGAQNTDDLVDSLPTDHTMTALIESANILSQKHACYLHRSVDASSLCLQCSVKLCQNCIEGHKSLPVTSFHKLEDLSTLTLEGLTTTRHEPCSDHPGKTLELFCTLHNVLICHVCATSKHRPCPEVIDQQEMFEKYKQTLSEMEDELNMSISTFTQIMTKIQEHQVKSEKNTKMALEHIDITCNGLLNSVEACRKRLKTLVQEADDKIKATAIEQKSSLGDRRGRLTANLNLIQRVLQVASCSSLVTMVPKLKHRITKLDLDAALPEDARQGFKIMTLTIDREALVHVERELRNIGDVVISSVSVQDKRIPLTTVQASSATHLNRANRQFAAGSGDLCCNQIPMQITGATSPGIGFVTDFVTKSGIKISVYKADITQLTVDAIVNGANENLLHGGGVAFAIAKAAGPDLEVEGDEYIRKFGPLKVSEVVKTTAGRLPCIAVLHAVGPRWDDYQNKEECKQALQQTVYNCLRKSHDLNYTSLAVTSISSESNSSSKDLEEFTAGLCMAVLNYVKKSDGPVNCIYIYAENVEVFRVMVHVINVKIREYESSSRLLNEAGIKQSYSDPINKILPTCKICLDEIVNSKTLSCGHTFCEKCITRWFNIQKVCPCCKSAQGLLTGNQPVDGKMEIKRQPFSLKGFDSKDCFKIGYSFPPGKQSEEHPNPGKHYSGTNRVAFIPNTAEGRKVLMLLKVAFDRRLVFTVGTSATSGCNDTIIWNGIHHKTNTGGGIEYHGYPDDTYLTRVQQELKDMGVTVKDLSEEQKDFIQHPRHVYKYIV